MLKKSLPIKESNLKSNIAKPLLFLFLLIAPLGAVSQNKLDSLKKSLTQTKNDSSIIETKLAISREYHRQEDHLEDIEVATQTVEHALLLNDTLLYARALNNLGLLYRYHQQYSDAIPLHKKAFDITEHKNIPPLDKMIFANNTGVASRYNADYNTAVKYYLKALKIAEHENDLRNIEIASNGLGNTLIAIPNRRDEALSYLERALEVAKSTNNKLGIAMNYLTISNYYDQKGQYSISRRYLNDLLAVNKEIEDNFGMAMTYQSIGGSYLNENKDLNTARFYFTKSLDLFIQLGDPLKQAHVKYNLGTIYFQERDLKNSLTQFEESMKQAEALKNKRLIMNNAKMISDVYEEFSEHKKALAYYKVWQQYKDSINLFEQEVEITAINNLYNFEKKESEIKLLKKDNSLQDAQLALNNEKLKSRSVIIFLMAFSIFSLLLLAFLQRRNRQIRLKTEKLILEQENEKVLAIYEKNLMEAEMLATRMQVNPHFLFNCLNSIKYMIQSSQNEKAMEYLIIFSRFIRMVLETSNKPLNTICDELELVRYYLQLEENRFDDEFTFTIENKLEGKLDEIILPTLLLQPFVENAIWHGLLPSSKEKKTVSIIITSNKMGTLIVIDDNGVGRNAAMANSKHKSMRKSMGNKITFERIALFNKNYPFLIDCDIIDKLDSEGNPLGTCVSLLIQDETKQINQEKELYSNP